MKLHVHYHTMGIYIHFKFHEIPFIGYQVNSRTGTVLFYATDGNEKCLEIQWFQNCEAIPSCRLSVKTCLAELSLK